MNPIVKETIKYLVESAETLSKKPRHMAEVHYVKNEHFPTGVYRVHSSRFAAVSLYDLFTDEAIQTAIVELGVGDFVEFCKSSLWLTIYVR